MSTVADEILTREALDFVSLLHRELNPRRLELLEHRRERHAEPRNPEVLEVGRATGASRKRPPTSSTGASRSPARSTAR